MTATEITFSDDEKSSTIARWRVPVGAMISIGRVLFLYRNIVPDDSGNALKAEKKFRATHFGRVTELLVKPNDVIQPGQAVLLFEGCRHPTAIKDLCADCGADLRKEGTAHPDPQISKASIPMVHSVPELKVSPELAQKIGKEDEMRLLNDKKLVLLVDLDQTIIHTTNEEVDPNIKDVYHFQLYGPMHPWYHTRLRPHTQHFLSEMSRFYELHICTFGVRNYAHKIASLLDRDGLLFSHRILSRDECFDPASKTANLKALFPCGDNMVCIIDDREDVWQGCGNLVQVKPYYYFRHTGDINAPPGFEKRDSDLQSLQEEEEEEEEEEEARSKVEESATSGKVADKADESSSKSERNSSEEKKSDKKTVEGSREGEKTGNKDKAAKEKASKTQDRQCQSEDHDDYLLYLEDILKRIHSTYYGEDQKSEEKRSLKNIIPQVRFKVLKGLHIAFSGLVPTHQRLEQSRAYRVARAFGAHVHQDLDDEVTHLVAIRPGTAKVNTARRKSKLHIVNPDWLWTCAERWEHVDERLYPLTTKPRGSRVPPPHCSSPDHQIENQEKRFADSINPLMSFTKEEIDDMGKEVDEDSDDQEVEDAVASDLENDLETGNDERCLESRDSESNDSALYFRRKRKFEESNSSGSNNGEEESEEDEDETLAEKFRRGGRLPDDLDFEDDSQDSMNLNCEENEDDGEWNEMGAALERGFLSES